MANKNLSNIYRQHIILYFNKVTNPRVTSTDETYFKDSIESLYIIYLSYLSKILVDIGYCIDGI